MLDTSLHSSRLVSTFVSFVSAMCYHSKLLHHAHLHFVYACFPMTSNEASYEGVHCWLWYRNFICNMWFHVLKSCSVCTLRQWPFSIFYSLWYSWFSWHRPESSSFWVALRHTPKAQNSAVYFRLWLIINTTSNARVHNSVSEFSCHVWLQNK